MMFIAVVFACTSQGCTFVTPEPYVFQRQEACESAVEDAEQQLRELGIRAQGTCMPLELAGA